MREIQIDQLATALQSGATVVDVRETNEYARAHVPGTMSIPMSRLTSRLPELDRSVPVHLICATGNRSGAMVHVLAAQGFDAVNVRGGTAAWTRAGHPVVRAAAPEGATR